MRHDDEQHTTDTAVPVPWQQDSVEALEAVPQLLVAWFHDEPDRIGQTASVEGPCFLGRPDSRTPGETPLPFFEARPGQSLATADLSSTSISRRQLELTPIDAERLRVVNVGKRALYLNGELITEGIARVGDTLMLEHTALFLMESRPRALPPRAYYPGLEFPFGRPDPHGMVGESLAAWDLRDRLASAAFSEAHVLLLGETGAGKEVAAQVLHGVSSRSHGPMIARNAATIPSTLLDAELFGSAKNYPNTGSPERQGLIGAAHHGHLMLDEIGELPESHQVHLLRVLDSDGQYHRLGEGAARVSNFRLVGATNRAPSALKPDVLARFRNRVQVPGLNERRSDIPFLIRELVARAARRSPAMASRFMHDNQVRAQPQLIDALLRHDYREHTRELDRLLAISIETSRSNYLLLSREVQEELSRAPTRAATPPLSAPAPADNDGVPRSDLVNALANAGGNVTQAANLLGVSRFTVHRLMKRYSLTRD
jgi:transcriptional regulator with GAF, ATPase, and Fis domain